MAHWRDRRKQAVQLDKRKPYTEKVIEILVKKRKRTGGRKERNCIVPCKKKKRKRNETNLKDGWTNVEIVMTVFVALLCRRS